MLRTDQQNRHAVRRLHRQQQPRSLCDRCLPSRGLRGPRFKTQNPVRMKLQQRNQFQVLRATRRLQAPPLFLYIFPLIPLGKSQVQDALPIQLAHPPDARAKPMPQPRQLGQLGNLQDAEPAMNTLRPSRCAPPTRVSPIALIALSPGSLGRRHECISIIAVREPPPRAREENFLIIGLGVDIAEVPRIKAAIERHGQPFLRRVFTPNEIEYRERFKNKFERYAGRFAAKEATMKALGTGWRRGVRWVDLEVAREQSGRPSIALAGEAAKIAAQLGVKHISLSITHTEAQALGQVNFED